ncbi:MAG: YdiU family protein [Idiomarina sp.]|nr:YdiU family protein [Idiomarina sp.]
MTTSKHFKPVHSLRELGDFFYRDAEPVAVKAPQWIAFNHVLADKLGIADEFRDNEQGLTVWAGNSVPDWAQPAALAYAGHQFANLVPQLGDGRAMLLAELQDSDGKRWDVQLKGAGRTPFSRGGDGRSAIGPVLREYLLSESMHALGVPTTRALAAVASGEQVFRDYAAPGAVFTRVASSHLRIGSFQFASLHGGPEKVRQLADYAIARHFPELNSLEREENSPEPEANSLEHEASPYLAFLHAVAKRQAELITHWQRIGFIHGVMNTDNCSISGETIDYGPAAFLDTYIPDKKFSAIDKRGRYAFSNQPGIARWNLARLAETLLPLFNAADTDEAIALATRVLSEYNEYFQELYLATMGKKLGIANAAPADNTLIEDFLTLLQAQEVDYTQAFWQLANELDEQRDTPAASIGPQAPASALFYDTEAFAEWRQRWLARLAESGIEHQQTQALMRSVNPALIPRNHRIAEAIQAVEEHGDLQRFHELLQAWQHPYKMPTTALEIELYQAPKENEQVQRTFCGT